METEIIKVKRSKENDICLLKDLKYEQYSYTEDAFKAGMESDYVKELIKTNMFPITLYTESYSRNIFETSLMDYIGTLIGWDNEYYEIKLFKDKLKEYGINDIGNYEIIPILNYISNNKYFIVKNDVLISTNAIRIFRIQLQFNKVSK